MSEYADDATEGTVNIHGSVMEPAAPVASEYETESPEHEPDELEASYAERLAELEGEQATPEYIEGVRDAARALGIVEPVEPGEPGYAEYAQAEMEKIQAETRQVLDQIGRYVEASGDPRLEALAVELGQNLLTARQEAAYEAQAQAEEAEYQREAQLERGQNVFHETIDSTLRDVGVDEGGADPEQVAELAAEVHRALAERHGPEVADQLAEEIVRRVAVNEADENEGYLSELYGKAERVASAMGNAATPGEIVDLSSQLYQRELYRAGGDTNAAARESLLTAAKVAAGFGEKTQPLNMSVTELHSSLDKAIPRTPEPKPEHKVQMRDARGRFTTSGTTPIAAKYAAQPPKSPAQVRTDAQKEAIKQAFQHLGGNAVESWRNR